MSIEAKGKERCIGIDVLALEGFAYAEAIVDTVRESLVVLRDDLRICSANPSFYRVFNVTSEQTLGEYIYDLGNRQWDIPELRRLLEGILPQNEKFDNFEVEHKFEGIGEKIMVLNARRLQGECGKTQLILLAIEDITDRKQAQKERDKLSGELQDAHAKLRILKGLLPICASCKKIRDDAGYWTQLEAYIRDHSEAEFSHSICPDCVKKLYHT
ncbi:MAG: PAS domain-containing protein [Pseudomonadota bacterium]